MPLPLLWNVKFNFKINLWTKGETAEALRLAAWGGLAPLWIFSNAPNLFLQIFCLKFWVNSIVFFLHYLRENTPHRPFLWQGAHSQYWQNRSFENVWDWISFRSQNLEITINSISSNSFLPQIGTWDPCRRWRWNRRIKASMIRRRGESKGSDFI